MAHKAGPAARQPIVIWFGRVGDLILLSALLDALHHRYGSPCRLVGAGAWVADIYRTHRDVAEVIYVRRYTPFVFDPAWWRSLFALRRGRGDPVYICETDPEKIEADPPTVAFERNRPWPVSVHQRRAELQSAALG